MLSEIRVRKSRKLAFHHYALKCESNDYVKQDQVNNANSASIFMINLLIIQGCQSWSGWSGCSGGLVGPGGPGGPSDPHGPGGPGNPGGPGGLGDPGHPGGPVDPGALWVNFMARCGQKSDLSGLCGIGYWVSGLVKCLPQSQWLLQSYKRSFDGKSNIKESSKSVAITII